MTFTRPEYKVEILGTPYEDTVEQLVSNAVATIGGPVGVSGSIEQNVENSNLNFGDATLNTDPNDAIFDDCDATTDWVATQAAINPTTDAVEKVEGDASLNLGKDNSVILAIYTKTIDTPLNVYSEDSVLSMRLYIEDTTTLDKIKLVASNGVIVYFGSSSSDYYAITTGRDELSVGWNSIGGIISDEFTAFGSPDIYAMDFLRLTFYTNNTADTVALGDMKMDWWYTNLIDLYEIEKCEATGFTELNEAIAETVNAVEFIEGSGALNLGKTAGAVDEVETTIDNCESITGWVISTSIDQASYTVDPVLNSTYKVEGTYSIQLGHDQQYLEGGLKKAFGGPVSFSYAKTGLGPYDATDGSGYIWLRLAEASVLSRLNPLNAVTITFYKAAGSQGFLYKNYNISDLTHDPPWQKLGGDFLTDFNYYGTDTRANTIAAIDSIAISIQVNSGFNAINPNEILMDNWHIVVENVTEGQFGYEKGSLGPFDCGEAATSEGYMELYIKDAPTLAKLRATDAVKIIFMDTNPASSYYKYYDRADLSTGWNTLGGNIANDFTLVGVDPITDINKIKIVFFTNNATDAITLADIIMDYWRIIDKEFNAIEEYLEETRYIGQQVKTVDHDVFISSTIFKLGKTGSPSDTVRCRLMNSSYGILATSTNAVTVTSEQEYTFSFNAYRLVANTTYIFAVYRTGNFDVDNYYYVTYNNSSLYADGALVEWTAGSWSVEATYDCYFKVNYTDPYTKVAQSITAPTANSSALEITVFIQTVGAPTDGLKMELLDSSMAQLAISTDLIKNAGEQTFNFNFSLTPGEVYYFSVYRVSDVNASNYYQLKYQIGGDVYDGGNFTILYDATWTAGINNDLKFKITRLVTLTQNDITTDVKMITINKGKNKYGETIQRGVCNLELINEDNKYDRNNTSSSVFGLYEFFQKFRITATYNGIVYGLFTGVLTQTTPNLQAGKPFVQATLEDEFVVLEGKEVSIGLQTLQTADELVEALLDETDFDVNARDVEADAVQLKTVTWDDVLVLDKLNTVVEAGQHNHWIDGNGNYKFRNNQANLDATPDYVFFDEKFTGARITDNVKTIINKATVNYDVASTATFEDTNSSNAYGVKSTTIDNELQPTNGIYADAMANYIVNVNKYPGTNLEFSLQDDFPDQLTIDFLSKVQWISDKTGIDDIYIIEAITHRIDPKGAHTTDYKSTRRVGPPIVRGASVFVTNLGSAWLDLNEANGSAIGQSFKPIVAGTMYNAVMNLKYDLDVDKELSCRLYAADGSGFPTGNVIATSNPVSVSAGTGSGSFTFDFVSATSLSISNTYVLTVNMPLTQVAAGGSETGAITIPGNVYTPMPSNSTTHIGQSFTAPRDMDLSNITVSRCYYNTGGGSITATMEIYASGTGAFDNLPTGGVLATATTSVSGTQYETNLQFNFGSPASLTSGNKYVAVLEIPRTTITSPTLRPFVGSNTIKIQDLGTPANVLRMYQEFVAPWSTTLTRIDFAGWNSNSNATTCKIYSDSGSLLATSASVSNGQFTFGSPPALTYGTTYRAQFDVPAASRVDDGLEITGTVRGSTSQWIDQLWVFANYWVSKTEDFDIKLYGGNYDAQAWQMWYRNNAYNGGKGSYYNGSWIIWPGGALDFGWVFNYVYGVTNYSYLNYWEVLGESTGTYADGKAAELVSGSWATKHPWDYFAQITTLDD